MSKSNDGLLLFLAVMLVEDAILGRFLSEFKLPLLSFSSILAIFSVRRFNLLTTKFSLLSVGVLTVFLYIDVLNTEFLST